MAVSTWTATPAPPPKIWLSKEKEEETELGEYVRESLKIIDRLIDLST